MGKYVQKEVEEAREQRTRMLEEKLRELGLNPDEL
jgi:hypothetical protein